MKHLCNLQCLENYCINQSEKGTGSSQSVTAAKSSWTFQAVSAHSAFNNPHLWTWQDYIGQCLNIQVQYSNQISVYLIKIAKGRVWIRERKEEQKTEVKVGQGVIHHMTWVRMLTDSFRHTHTHTHTKLLCCLAGHENCRHWPQAWEV